MLKSHIQSIPCQIEVTLFRHHPGSGNRYTATCPSDYYGDTEIEFEVYDRKGYRAKWLERKLTAEDVARIEREIIENGDK